MKPLITPLFLLFPFVCFAQKQNIYFLKNDGLYVNSKDSADYIRIVREPDSASVLFNVFEYYINGTKKLIGKSLTIDPPRYEGERIIYYKNGKKQAISNLKNSHLVGEQIEYYPNGKIYRIIKYADSTDKTPKIGDFETQYLINAEYDSLGTPIVTNANGHYKGFDEHFTVIEEEGDLINGQKTGTWRGDDLHTHINYKETYENGRLVSGVSYGQLGDSVTYVKVNATVADYKGGLTAFYQYIGREVEYPTYERSHNIQGRVILSFVIEKDGSISNAKILSSVSKNIDAEALRVINNSPHWIPATMYGRKVRSYYTIPLNFALRN